MEAKTNPHPSGSFGAAEKIRRIGYLCKQYHEDILIVFAAFITMIFVIRMFWISVFDKYDLRNREAYRTVGISENMEMRGNIYDCNGNTLAYATPAYNLILSPYDILDMKQTLKNEAIIAGEEKGDKKDAAEQNEKNAALCATKAKQIAVMLSTYYPEIKYDDVLSEIYLRTDALRHGKNSGAQYYIVLRHISESEKKQIEDYIEKINDRKDIAKISKISGADVYFETTQERIYPYGSTAAIVLGYRSEYDKAQNGIEEYYNMELSGVADRRITGRGTSSIITGVFNNLYEGTDSRNLYTTLDINIQKIVEDAVAEVYENTHAASVHAAVVETKTGKILAMTNTPGYDANDPTHALDSEINNLIFKTELKKKQDEEKEKEKENGTEEFGQNAEAETETAQDVPAGVFDDLVPKDTFTDNEKDGLPKDYNETGSTAVTARTNNNNIIEYFYPGSIYKAFLVAAALEEGMTVNYKCEGRFVIPDSDMGNGENRSIGCALDDVHGDNDEKGLLVNSCNICAAQLGLAMGADIFFQYYQAFGFTEGSGLDLAQGSTAPSTALYHTTYDNTDLATCSFGQNNKVSTIQLAMAMSVFGNGGKLMIPYIIDHQTDGNGNVVEKTEPQVRRQVISQRVVDRMNECLQAVVTEGSGSKAGLENYRIAGKTGTAQNIEVINGEEVTVGHVTSFAGYGPATDPVITVVVNILDPKDENGSFSENQLLASDLAAPVAGKIFSQTLEYLGVPYDK